MENKENFIVIVPSASVSAVNEAIDYSKATSINVIRPIEDVNSVLNCISICIDNLNNICTDQFCQMNQSDNFFINLSNKIYPRVLSYNGLSGSISAVLANAKINDQFLSASTTNLNLVTYDPIIGYSLVKSMNGTPGHVSGLTTIRINNLNYTYTEMAKGFVDLGSYKYIDHPYLRSINSQSGVVKIPTGIVYKYTVNGQEQEKLFACNENGNIDITYIFNDVLNADNNAFTNLYVTNVDVTNPNSVINLNYVNKKQLEIAYVNKYLTSNDIKKDITLNKNYININPQDNNFISFIYGIQNGVYKDIHSFYVPPSEDQFFASKLYDKGIPLTFVLLEGNGQQCKLKLIKKGGPTSVNLFYSLNYKAYEVFPASGVNINIGDVISLSGNNNTFSVDINNYYTLDIENSTRFACYGNIMSLVNWDTEIKTNYQFYALFSGSNIIKAPSLPATTLTPSCYDSMFKECKKLIVPPQLPASSLVSSCYQNMFYSCHSLSSVPVLPATELADACYKSMFYRCNSLTIIPYYLLPATVMQPSCYYNMFGDCKELTDGPLLPATTLADSCYYNMFYFCSSLTAAHADCTSVSLLQTNTSNYAYEWLEGTSRSGVTLYNTALWNDIKSAIYHNENKMYYDYSNTDLNYTNVKKVGRSLQDTPLTFEVLSSSGRGLYLATDNNTNTWNLPTIYTSKDGGGTWSNRVWNINNVDPIIGIKPRFIQLLEKNQTGYLSLSSNSTTWSEHYNEGKYIYFHIDDSNQKIKIMGNVMSLVNRAKEIQNPFQFFCLFSHTQNHTNGTIINNIAKYSSGYFDAHQLVLPSPKVTQSCYDRMFLNCINLSAAPQFATTIPVQKAQYCYKGMFWNCSSLVNVPNLPATNIANSNYQNMFWNCTSLVSPPSLNYITISQPSSFQGMFMGCSNLKYCQDINTSSLSPYCCNDMFKGCINLTIPPSINVFNVDSQSCYAMFAGCTNLQYIPPLLPTVLNISCYNNMFADCTNLISDQTYLPATELAPSCYYEMFKNNNINFITVKFTDWNTSNFSTTNWLVNNQAQNLRGTFQCYDVLDINVRGDSGIPTNWEINLNGNISKLIFNDNIVAGSLQLFYLRKK